MAALARDAGVKNARGTPSVAIGSYDAAPLDMAGAYTIFANNGLHLDPWMLASVRTTTGDIITDYPHDSKQLLDPRVAYLTTNMMQNVIATVPAPGCVIAAFCSGSGQNRHQPRCLVCGLHQQSALRRLGGQ